MGAPGSGMVPAEQPAADGLLEAFKTIDASDKQKHEAVLNYWLSIRGNRELPPLRDLDPLEISDAGPCSVLLELIGGGEDADIRHLGEKLKAEGAIEKISQAPRPSILSSIARKLSLVAISRNFLAFEDEYQLDGGAIRCWVTLLPLSSAGAWVDYVYAFVSFQRLEAGKATQPVDEAVAEEISVQPEEGPAEPEDVLELDSPVEDDPQPVASAEQAEARAAPTEKPAGFSFDGGSGFYATKAVKVKPKLPDVASAKAKVPAPAPEPEQGEPEPVAEEASTEVHEEPETAPEETVEAPALEGVEAEAEPEPEPETETATEDEPQLAAAEEQPHMPVSAMEGSLQSKLTDVRAKADEARQAKLRANAALYEGLGAAYDFALDAEDAPEEYLRLVEAQGLKIQLRAPMKPVVKLAFDGLCDDATIAQLEAVLAWALKEELPRGTLAERLEAEGGMAGVLNGAKKAA